MSQRASIISRIKISQLPQTPAINFHTGNQTMTTEQWTVLFPLSKW